MNACRLLLHLCFVGSRQRGWRRSAECGLEVQGLAMACQGCPGWHPPSTLYCWTAQPCGNYVVRWVEVSCTQYWDSRRHFKLCLCGSCAAALPAARGQPLYLGSSDSGLVPIGISPMRGMSRMGTSRGIGRCASRRHGAVGGSMQCHCAHCRHVRTHPDHAHWGRCVAADVAARALREHGASERRGMYTSATAPAACHPSR